MFHHRVRIVARYDLDSAKRAAGRFFERVSGSSLVELLVAPRPARFALPIEKGKVPAIRQNREIWVVQLPGISRRQMRSSVTPDVRAHTRLPPPLEYV